MNKHRYSKKRPARLFTALFALTAVIFASSTICFADIPSPTEYFYAADYANVLSDSTEENILSGSEYLDELCDAQIVVATVNFTDGMDISDYAYKMFNDWQIGSENNTGLLILLAIGDDNYYVMPGKGFEDSLSAGSIQTILDEYMEPDFAVQNYDDAVIKTYDKLYTEVSNICGSSYSDGNASGDDFQQYENNGNTPGYNNYGTDNYYEDSDGSALLGFLIILFLAVIMILIIKRLTRSSKKRSGSADNQNYNNNSYYNSGNMNGNIYPPGIHPPNQNRPPQPPPRNTFFFFGGRPRPPKPPRPPRPPHGGPFGGMGGGPSGPSRPSGGSPFGGGGSTRGGGAGRSSRPSRPSSSGRTSRPSGGSRPTSGFSGRSHSGGGGSTRGGGAGRK